MTAKKNATKTVKATKATKATKAKVTSEKKWVQPKTVDENKRKLASENEGKRLIALMSADDSRCIEGSQRYKALSFVHKAGKNGCKVEAFVEKFPSQLVGLLTARGQVAIRN
jgi:hypothetical protein